MELLSRYGCAWCNNRTSHQQTTADYLDEIIFTPADEQLTFNITPDIAERTADVYSTASPAQQASLNYDSDIMETRGSGGISKKRNLHAIAAGAVCTALSAITLLIYQPVQMMES